MWMALWMLTAAPTITKRLIEKDDFDLTQTDGAASDNATVATSTGGTMSVTKPHGGMFPWNNAYDRTIRPGDIVTKGPWVDIRAYLPSGYVTNGTVDYKTQLQSAATAAAGKRLYIPDGTFGTSVAISISSNTHMFGTGTLKLLGDNTVLSLDGVDNVTIQGIRIDGNKASYSATGNNGIDSPANGTGTTNVTIEDVTIKNMGGAGIMFLAQTGSHSKNIKIINTRVLDSAAHGIIAQDFVDDFLVQNCRVVNFGLAVADRPGITGGRSANNTQILGNYVESDGNSQGASPHGISVEGSNAVVSGNIVKASVGYGIEVGIAHNVSVTGNEIYNATIAAIALAGAEAEGAATVVSVAGNVIKDGLSHGIYVYVSSHSTVFAEGISITGNTIDNVAGSGMLLVDVKNAVVSGNAIINSAQSGIYVDTCINVDINANVLNNNNTSADGAHEAIVKLVAGSTSIRINGYIARDSAGYTTSGTGEDTLFTMTIPQYFYKNYRGIRFTTSGTKSGSAGNKTIKVYFGTTVATFHAAANDTNDWRVTGEVLFHSYNFQEMGWLGWNGATPLQGYEDSTVDMSAAATTFKFTGECANGADSIAQNQVLVEAF